MVLKATLLAAALILIASACGEDPDFQGNTLNVERAPDFRLHDQHNGEIALSDFRGKVVALTFLYTYCPEICPGITETMRKASDILADEAGHLQFLAVSVDPERDTVETAYSYSRDTGLHDRWRFLVGSREELEPVWKAYWLDPSVDTSVGYKIVHLHEDGELHVHEVDDGGGASTGDLKVVREGPLISHSAPVFLIDREGNRRVLLNDLALDPAPLVHDLRILLDG